MLRRTVCVVILAAAACKSSSQATPVGPGAGTGSAAAAAGLVVAPPFAGTGERMSYQLSLGGIEIAAFDFGVGEVTDLAGKRALEIQSHARAAGAATWISKIDDRLTSWVDVTTGRPLRFVVDEKATDGDELEHTDAQLAARAGETFPVEVSGDTPEPKTEQQHVTLPDVWDFNSFLTAMRGWDAPVGSTVTCEVMRSRYLWHVQMTIHGKEKRLTDLGELPALRLDGLAYKLTRTGEREAGSEQRHFTLWISDDADRVPLALDAITDYGSVKMAITDYAPGPSGRLRQ